MRVEVDLNWRKGRYQRAYIEDFPVAPAIGMKVLFTCEGDEVPGTIIGMDDMTAWGSYDHA